MPVIFEEPPEPVITAANTRFSKFLGMRSEATVEEIPALVGHYLKPGDGRFPEFDETRGFWHFTRRFGEEVEAVEAQPQRHESLGHRSWLSAHVFDVIWQAIEERLSKMRPSKIEIIKCNRIALTAIRIEDHDGENVRFNALFQALDNRSGFQDYNFEDFWAKVVEHQAIMKSGRHQAR